MAVLAGLLALVLFSSHSSPATADQTHATFAPTTEFPDFSQINVKVTTGVKDPIGKPLQEEVVAAFRELRDDAAVRVVVLTGAGRGFCAGVDLEHLKRSRAGEEGPGPKLGEEDFLRVFPLELAEFPKPVIAAINGAAVAGGMELALWCDFRIMARDAYMGVFCRRWGVPLIDGGTVRLPRLVGSGRAMELILTGRRVDADECAQIGLCERIADRGGARRAALEIARELAAFPQSCLRADRKSALNQAGLDAARALEEEFWNSLKVIKAEGIPGARRFVAGEGRHGDFGGR